MGPFSQFQHTNNTTCLGRSDDQAFTHHQVVGEVLGEAVKGGAGLQIQRCFTAAG